MSETFDLGEESTRTPSVEIFYYPRGYWKHPDDAYPTIEQVVNGVDSRTLKPWIKLPNFAIVRATQDNPVLHYNLIKTTESRYTSEATSKVLGTLFAMFNHDERNPLSRFHELGGFQDMIRDCEIHTSMSVGDIVKISNQMYYCDDFGWTKLKSEADI